MEEAAGESDRLSRRLSESEARLSEALLAAASSEASAEVVEGDAEEKDAVIRGLREELERAKAESIELRAEIEGAAAGGVDAEAEAALREEVRSLQAERDRLSGELQSSKDLLRESSETNERAKSNVEDLKKKFLATAKKKQLEFKIDHLQRRLAEQEESTRAALAEAGEGSKNGQAEAEALRTEKEALEARPKELEALAETQRGAIADLEGRAKAAEEGQGQRQEGQAKKLKAAVLELKRKLDRSEKARQRDAKDLARAQASLDGEREKMRQAEEASGHQTSRLASELKT